MPFSRVLERLVHRLEAATVLDKPADAAVDLLNKVIKPGVVEDTLSGTQVGHPVHPALVAVPIGAWTTGLLLDLTGADDDAARAAVGFGILTAMPTALTGASDWRSTAGAERRVGLVHAVSTDLALGLQAASWFARRKGDRGRGVALSAAAMGLTAIAGWLGGHLAYAMGVGVDTTAFQKLPEEWLDVAAESDVPTGAATVVDAGGAPVLLARVGGDVVALADRCTHRGAPLHEGEVADGCVTCPWHDSVFALADGAVVSGPATRPQPMLDVEVVAGRVRVRRRELRTLRTNPTT